MTEKVELEDLKGPGVKAIPHATLTNPLGRSERSSDIPVARYEQTLERGRELQQSPYGAAGQREYTASAFEEPNDGLGEGSVCRRRPPAGVVSKLGAESRWRIIGYRDYSN